MITDNIPLSCFIVMIVMIVVMMKITTTNSGLLITRRNQSGLEADYHLHTIQLRSIKNTIQSKFFPFFFNINHDLDSNISSIQFNSDFRHFLTFILIGMIIFSGWFRNSYQITVISNFRITPDYTINVIPGSNNTFIKL